MVTDKNIYRNICKSHEAKIPIFYQDWWLDISCQAGTWNACSDTAQNKHVNGIWPIYKHEKMGRQFIIEPPFTPYLSPFCFLPQNITKQNKIYSFEDDINQRMISQLSSKAFKRFRLQPDNQNWYAFYQSKWRSHLRYTYTLSEIKEDRLGSYKASVRNDINKARERFAIVIEDNASNLLSLHQMSLSRKGAGSNNELSILSQLCQATLDREAGFILSIKNKEDQAIASCFVVYDNESSYLLSLGIDKSKPIQGSVQLLIHEAINKASKHVDRFDFEGSMISEVEPVFRAFGGKRTPVIEVSWAPKWAEILFILMNKRRW